MKMGAAGSLANLLRDAEKIKYVVMRARPFYDPFMRKETTMSLKWIAEQLEMGSGTHVSDLLVAQRRKEQKFK